MDMYTWHPCPRSTGTGHRVADQIGFHPIETRNYPWWPWWPLELLSRIAARKVGQDKLSERLIRGVEPDREQNDASA